MANDEYDVRIPEYHRSLSCLHRHKPTTVR
jgi:hypothetical protein